VTERRRDGARSRPHLRPRAAVRPQVGPRPSRGRLLEGILAGAGPWLPPSRL